MQMCVHMSSHVSQSTCLAYIVTCEHPLQVAVRLCTSLYSAVESTVLQYLYFMPRMSGSKRRSSSDVAGTTVLFKVLYCKVKNVSFGFCVCFLCIICVKSMINLLRYSRTQPVVLVAHLGWLCWTYAQTGLRQVHSWSRTRSWVGDLLYLAVLSPRK